MKKVIALTRVSTLSQELESQKLKVISAIHADGYSDDEIISISNKESGVLLSEEEMLGLDQMKREIQERKTIEAVYVFELSRVARQAKILYSIRDFLVQNKVQLVCLNPNFRMFTAEKIFDESSNVIFGLYCSLAENEGYIRKQRFKRGKEKAKAEGKFIGGKVLFGYTLDKNNHFIIHEENSKLIKRIYNLYLSGEYSARQISDMLYKEGTIKQTSKKTREIFICKILKNRKYFDNTLYPPIVSEGEWNNAQELLKKYQIKPRRTYEKNIYLGHKILFVEENTRQMVVCKPDAAYVEPISAFHVNINMVDSLLLYCTEYSSEFHRKSDIEDIIKKQEEKRIFMQKKLNNYTVLEKEIKTKIDRIEERIIIGKISPEKAAALETRFEKELKELVTSRQKDSELITILEKNLEAIRSSYEDDRTIYELSDEEQYERIRQEIEKVWVGRIKNSHYILRIKYRNPLIDGQIYEIYSKQKRITYGGKTVNVKIIERIKRRK